jgi:hypothetical protein
MYSDVVFGSRLLKAAWQHCCVTRLRLRFAVGFTKVCRHCIALHLFATPGKVLAIVILGITVFAFRLLPLASLAALRDSL